MQSTRSYCNNLKPKTERAKNNIIYTCVHVLKYIAAWKKQNNTFALLNYRTTKTDIKIKLVVLKTKK